MLPSFRPPSNLNPPLPLPSNPAQGASPAPESTLDAVITTRPLSPAQALGLTPRSGNVREPIRGHKRAHDAISPYAFIVDAPVPESIDTVQGNTSAQAYQGQTRRIASLRTTSSAMAALTINDVAQLPLHVRTLTPIPTLHIASEGSADGHESPPTSPVVRPRSSSGSNTALRIIVGFVANNTLANDELASPSSRPSSPVPPPQIASAVPVLTASTPNDIPVEDDVARYAPLGRTVGASQPMERTKRNNERSPLYQMFSNADSSHGLTSALMSSSNAASSRRLCGTMPPPRVPLFGPLKPIPSPIIHRASEAAYLLTTPSFNSGSMSAEPASPAPVPAAVPAMHHRHRLLSQIENDRTELDKVFALGYGRGLGARMSAGTSMAGGSALEGRNERRGSGLRPRANGEGANARAGPSRFSGQEQEMTDEAEYDGDVEMEDDTASL